jgi:hypothetical protein
MLRRPASSSVMMRSTPLDSEATTIHEIIGGRLYYDCAYKCIVANASGGLVSEASIEVDTAYALDVGAGARIFTRPSLDSIPSMVFETVKLRGTVMSLLSLGCVGFSYGHWLTDLLPMLALQRRNIPMASIDWYLVPSLAQQWQVETFELLEIPLEKIVVIQTPKLIVCERLIVTGFPRPHWSMPMWVPYAVDGLFSQIRQSASPMAERIYVSRADGSWRKLVNEEELMQQLEGFGFKKLVMSDISLKETVDTFRQADCVVGVWGSGMDNVLFCNSNTLVVELFGPTMRHRLREQICRAKNINYESVDCDFVTPHDTAGLSQIYKDLKVNIANVTNLIQATSLCSGVGKI